MSDSNGKSETERNHENGVCPECGIWVGVGVEVRDGIGYKCTCGNVWKEVQD